MAFHHIALATRDLEATHRFYTEACGFELVKVDAMPFLETGWARHCFYDTGNGEMFAVWDLHSDKLAEPWPTAISTGLGLPNFINHVAFASSDLDDLARRRDRWVANGHDVAEIDHGWCTSIYTDDPNGIMVEFCTTTRVFTAHDHDEARRLLGGVDPSDIDTTPPSIEFFVASEHAADVS
jgi:catechol 2,3-dioxygenase-like lactoylglutathione lyase family enzyme